MSLVIHVDEHDTILGEVPREKAHEEGLLHRIAVVYVTNVQGEILIQERMDGRLDHSSAGHVDPGETYLDAAKRELCEELGICEATLTDVGYTRTDERYKGAHIRHQFAVYKTIAEPKQLNTEEVKRVYWESPLSVLEKMKNDPEHITYTGGFHASLALFLQKTL